MKAHCPSVSAIKDKYYELYRGNGAGSSSGPREDDEVEAEAAAEVQDSTGSGADE